MKIMKRGVLLFFFIIIGIALGSMTAYAAEVPGSCTQVESGSSVTMSVVSMKTTSSARFILSPSDNTPLELNHDIRVSELNGVPSQGKVTAFMQGMIQEGRGTYTSAYEKIEFKERTSLDGYLSLFDKNMRYSSGMKR